MVSVLITCSKCGKTVDESEIKTMRVYKMQGKRVVGKLQRLCPSCRDF